MSIPVTPGAAAEHASNGLKYGLIGFGSLMLVNSFGLQSLVPIILPFILIGVGVKMAAH